MPVRPPVFPLTFSSFLYADRLKRTGLSTGFPFPVQLGLLRRTPEACRSVHQASFSCSARSCTQIALSVPVCPPFLFFFCVHVVSVPFDSTHVWCQVSRVVFQQKYQSCSPPQGMFMRCVLRATEAHNLLEMWWCLTDGCLQRLAQSRGETSSNLTDDGLDDGGSL